MGDKFRKNISETIPVIPYSTRSWWRHQMELFSALLALCDWTPSVTRGFTPQRPVTKNLNVFFDLRLNKRMIKQSRRRWFETLSCSLWRHCNVLVQSSLISQNVTTKITAKMCPWRLIERACLWPRFGWFAFVLAPKPNSVLFKWYESTLVIDPLKSQKRSGCEGTERRTHRGGFGLRK